MTFTSGRRNFRGRFPKGYGDEKKIFNACSGPSTHRHNYLKMLEFGNKNFSKSTPPTTHIL
jgi:hypothetical protein